MKKLENNRICIVLGFSDLFDENPKSINYYLSGIQKDVLLKYAIYYCSLSTKLKPTVDNIFFPFLNEGEKETNYYKGLVSKISHIIDSKSPNPTILNVKSSLKLFELIKGCTRPKKIIDYTDNEIRYKLLKAYLVLNTNNHVSDNHVSESEDFNKLVLSNSLNYMNYSDTNLYHLRITELIKSCIFLEYCEDKYPEHLAIFLLEYGLKKWSDYTLYLHQVGMIIMSSNIHSPLTFISIPLSDKKYNQKKSFLEKFVIQETYLDDQDFTLIKSFPIEWTSKNEFCVVFERFFIEKIYRSLYFKFNEINENLKSSDSYLKNFRSDFGLSFSEQKLLNKILMDSLGKKYKHLGYKDLKRDKSLDYYIRDGNKVFLFECKDNLINKKIIEFGNVDNFIDEMRRIFLQNQNGKDKAIKQLINNIETIRNGHFYEDSNLNGKKSIIYPIIVVHHSIFSLPGVNAILNNWFKEQLNSRQIKIDNIKNLTVIDIDTFVLYQGVICYKSTSLQVLIDSFWDYIDSKSNKNYSTENLALSGLLQTKNSFKSFLETELKDINIFTKEITKYNRHFN